MSRNTAIKTAENRKCEGGTIPRVRTWYMIRKLFTRATDALV